MTKNTEEGPYSFITEGGQCLIAGPGLSHVFTIYSRLSAVEVSRLNTAWLAGRSSVTAVPLSPEMVEKLINLIYTWMVDSAAEETGVTMEQFMTEIKSTPRVIKADSDLRTRLLGIR